MKFLPHFQDRISKSGHLTSPGNPCPASAISTRRSQLKFAWVCFYLRTLDAELRAHAKAVDESFDWQKLSFVLEAKGVAQDEELNKAQSKINNALQNSLQAGVVALRDQCPK